ncbi:hypothetical protein V1525DRAFT_411229 [Lipomyces kononenkoae]|uniref:Uncharacterized protein n=1 Tax=Lipomyces kononenkoae TaxID=34357 RepID=A0ACC3SUG9_LIPKO
MTYPLSDSFCTRFKIPKLFLPYYPGQQFTVVSHDPPEPTTYITRERESKHPLERCILHPPLPGSIGATTVYLRIVESVRLGDNYNAQVAKVQVECVIPHESSSPPQKFYDPLYFDHEQDDVDPFLCVDRHYSHEVAAYNALSDLHGSTIPRYFGSYSLELPAEATVRSVRLILMEFISGTSMLQLNPSDFSQLQSQVIMKAIVDAESLVYTHNLRHRDIHPRNILVLNTATAPYESPLLRWNTLPQWGHMILIWLPSWITKPLPPPPTGDSGEYSYDSDDYSELPRFSIKNIVDNPG